MKNKYFIAIIGLSGLIGGGLNYLYHPLILRYLSIEDFGTFQSLFGIFNIFSIIIVSLSIFLVKEISKNSEESLILLKIQKLLKRDIKILSLYMIGSFLVISIFTNYYLNIHNYFLFVLLAMSIVAINIEIYIFPFLQGLQKFNSIAFLRILGPLSRIITGVGLVALGFGIYGAIGGFIISQFILIAIGYKIMRKYLPKFKIEKTQEKTFLFTDMKNLKNFFISSIVLALFMNIDILIVKNMFDGETAGYYAAVSVLAKFLVFLGLSIETVYYPQLVKEKILPKMQVLKISVYYLAMTAGAIVFFILFGEFILRMFKGGLEEYIGLVYPLLVYCGLLAYLSVIVKTLIAFERYRINYILGVVIVGLVMSLYSFGSSPLLITQIFALFGAIGLVAGLWELRQK